MARKIFETDSKELDVLAGCQRVADVRLPVVFGTVPVLSDLVVEHFPLLQSELAVGALESPHEAAGVCFRTAKRRGLISASHHTRELRHHKTIGHQSSQVSNLPVGHQSSQVSD